MSATMTLVTADDFLALGESDEHMELIEGEIIVMNSPRNGHQTLTLAIAAEIRHWIRTGAGRGFVNIEFDQRLDDRNVFAPDVWWVREGRRPTKDASHLVGPPDLAIEVRSESTWRYDVGKKKKVYERNGLPELWLVDTRADSVRVFRRSTRESPKFDTEREFHRGEILTSPQLPGFSLDIAALFDS